MESWTGSRIYKLNPLNAPSTGSNSKLKETPRSSNQGNATEKHEQVIVEIQIKVLSFLGTESRLVLIRNVNYIIEQQKLQTRASYDRKLTNTLSHELLTPLNCIVNLSEHLKVQL
jgi:signal transduction histidine kinase